MTENQEHWDYTIELADSLIQKLAEAVGADPFYIKRMTIVLEPDSFALVSIDRIPRSSPEMQKALDNVVSEIRDGHAAQLRESFNHAKVFDPNDE